MVVMDPAPPPPHPLADREGRRDFTSAEMGAIAHLYRGEVYRSTIWRTRLDNTTNWAVVTLGIALSISFASPEASALPLLLVGVLNMVFLLFEARRYRYFNVWRARARWMETHFYAPMLKSGVVYDDGWTATLARDYDAPKHHISLTRAIGRRLRRTYGWILTIQALAYCGKLFVHPTPLAGLGEVWDRASVGPVPGGALIAFGALFNAGWATFAYITWLQDRRERDTRRDRGHVAMG